MLNCLNCISGGSQRGENVPENGTISGVGTGLMFMSVVTAVNRWFSTKRSLATGIALAGAGFGVFGFPPVIRLMIQAWGWREALQIEGAVALNGIAFSLLLTAVPKKRVPIEHDEYTIILQGSKNDGEELQPLQEKPVWRVLLSLPQKANRVLLPHSYFYGFCR